MWTISLRSVLRALLSELESPYIKSAVERDIPLLCSKLDASSCTRMPGFLDITALTDDPSLGFEESPHLLRE
jgi:hypothetical protein